TLCVTTSNIYDLVFGNSGSEGFALIARPSSFPHKFLPRLAETHRPLHSQNRAENGTNHFGSGTIEAY
ncbi:hypothetical protein, partial [uncultured Parasutterella sp.]|uniref:hypothetical protein n=1 Tax=uncultured Parasutterella sp. TaxID=1263098 RepID=UPI0025B34B61